MKTTATGIVRKIDELGRIVIPVEIRRVMNIQTAKEKGSDDKKDTDALEIFVNGEEIVLRKYNPGCHCCGSVDNLKEILGLKICPECLEEFNRARKLIDKIKATKDTAK